MGYLFKVLWSVAIAAAHRSKAIFIEKPFARSSEEAALENDVLKVRFKVISCNSPAFGQDARVDRLQSLRKELNQRLRHAETVR